MPKILVLDLDGTLIDPSNASMMQRQYLLSIVKPGIDAEALISEAEKHTLENSLEYAWPYKGVTTCFVEDSYIWRNMQANRMWESLDVKKEKEEFFEWMFNTFDPGELDLVEGASDLVRFAIESGVKPIIVTNSSPVKAKKVCKLMGVDIDVFGNAKKHDVNSNHPIKVGGRDCFTDRPSYEKILREVMMKNSASPKDVLVTGDILSLDLVLPNRLGMNCVMKVNSLRDGFRTHPVFIEAAKSLGIPSVMKLDEIKKIISEL